MEHRPSSLRPPETAQRAANSTRRRLSSRDLALKVCVATVAALVLGRLGPVAAAGGVAVSLVVENAVESLVRRLRKRTLWGVALLALLLDRADKALAAIGLRGRRAAAGPGAAVAATVVAAAIVVVGITAPEAALGHSLVSGERLTFFGGARHTEPVPPRIRLRLPHGVVAKAQGATRVTYAATAVGPDGGVVEVRCNPRSGSTFPLGVTTVHCAAGSTRGSFSVTVLQTKGPPLVLPPSPTVEATGPAGARVTYEVRSSPGAVVVCTPASGTVFAVGRKRVTCTATADGLSTRAGFEVLVTDSAAPVISAPATVESSTHGDAATVRYSIGARDAVDGPAAVECTPPSGSRFRVGTATVACTARDARGNRARRTFEVVVVRTEDVRPTLVLPAPAPVEASGPAGARVDYRASAREGSTWIPVRCDRKSASLFGLGRTRVECSATDARGKTTTGSFTVIVEDTTPPELRVPAALEREATSRRGAVVDYSAGASDRVSGALEAECRPGPGAAFPIATTTVTCSAKDAAGRVAVRSFPVRVFDAPPALRLPRDVKASAVAASGARVTYPAATAADRVDGALRATCAPASGSLFPLTTTDVVCTAEDSGGNVVRGTFHVTVRDTTAPKLTVPGRLAAAAGVPFAFDEAVAASDNVDGAVAVTCTPASGSTFTVGVHPVRCTATDAAGNAAAASFTVVATDRTPPVVTVPTAPVTAEAATAFAYTGIVSAVDAVDGTVPVTCSPPSGSVVALGRRTVACTAADAAGNKASASFTVIGTDTTPPVVKVPRAWRGSAGTLVPSSSIPVTATDTVDGTLKPTCSPRSVPVGTSTITCTATDRAGNVGSASFTATGTVPG
jgi:large repetitive protein